MELIVLGTAFALSVGTTLVLTPVVTSLALRRGWLDKPDEHRKIHLRPIPAIGGVALLAGIVMGVSYAFAFQESLFFSLPHVPFLVIVGLVMIFLTGLYDDIKGLGFKSKFTVQLAVGYLLLHAGYRIDVSQLPFAGDDPYTHLLISVPLTLLWVVGTINAVNLIDGLDGLAAGVVMIIVAALGAVFAFQGELGLVVFALIIVGALLAFLAFNFNPATVFMGDAGSLTLGYIVAVFTLSGKTSADPLLAILVPAVALGFPLLDAGLAVVRRLISGMSICAPDRDHIHHRVSRIWPQWRAVLALYAVTAVFGTAAVAMSVLAPVIGFSVFGITAAGAGAGLALLGYLRVRPFFEKQQDDAAEVLGVVAFGQHGGGDGQASRGVEDEETSQSVNVDDLLVEAREAVTVPAGEPGTNPDAATDEATERRKRTKRSVNKQHQQNGVPARFSRESIIHASEHLSVADLGGEAVVLDVNEGRYYGLNEVGARIIDLVRQPRKVEELVGLVGQEYEAHPEELERDVVQFLEELMAHALIRVEG